MSLKSTNITVKMEFAILKREFKNKYANLPKECVRPPLFSHLSVFSKYAHCELRNSILRKHILFWTVSAPV